MSKKINILYLDDEENNLVSFKSNFRKDYNIFLAKNAEEAFDLLEKNNINILITDQKMPVMSGVEFLEKTIQKYPDAIRLLITGYSDIHIVIDAVNKGQIHKYIEKPWDWETFKLILENCVDLYLNRIAIKEKNEQLEKALDELNRFIYSASHDLRSPLTSILGIIQLAKLEKKIDSEYLDIIEKNIHKLDEYIRNIIHYYQNTRSEQLIENIDFNKLIQQEIEMLNTGEETIKFETNVEQKASFSGDYFRIRLIFNNLISNAIKYKNPAQSQHVIKITVHADEKVAKIIISDNGIGIGEDHIGNIFKMFYRALGNHKKQGSGIGLFIVKESVERLNGSIEIKSKPNEGTAFEINLPNQHLN
ncbi:MAG: hybrid sensor histidine kinase/response regulator [Flavobacteriales bacterium]|nr:hybrid sensor histidine kinase/response regulator [Flavobacteriales bacterium]